MTTLGYRPDAAEVATSAVGGRVRQGDERGGADAKIRSPTSDLLLFGAVSVQNSVTAVVRRLRTAIALGVLSDGDRLPREPDLARQMGVTGFALREALSVLREEGLITTRPGNKGGSFVCHGTDRALVTAGELRRMSATELRELGDWRQMLASVSASLAAQRASDSSVKRLHEHVAALASATDDVEARRAHGRFHIELAAAAQSARMTQAELTMYEEFDWLLGLVLADPRRREKSANELAEIAVAVERRQPEAAHAAAQRHTASTVAALISLRLASIASGAAETGPVIQATPAKLAEEVSRVMGVVVRSLDALATKARQILDGDYDERHLQMGLSKVAMSALVASGLDLHGAGFLAEPSLIPDRKYWIAWWQLTADGVIPDHRHAVDERRDDFYDYTRLDFFTVPRRTGEPHLQGPYVDYGGTNDYIMTLSVPVLCDGRFAGVAAADMRVEAVERQLAPWLVASEPCAVINPDNRVIVANMVNQTVGDVVSPIAGYRSIEIPEVGLAVLYGRAT